MNLIRSLLFENVGLKLVALLMALVVYLHVYTDRPATLMMSFPVEIAKLDDSLAIISQTPAAVSAELKGTGKQLIRLRLAEPSLIVSLAGAGPGRFQRSLTAQDLPMVAQIGLEVSRFQGPQMLELQIERIDQLAGIHAVIGIPKSLELAESLHELGPKHLGQQCGTRLAGQQGKTPGKPSAAS